MYLPLVCNVGCSFVGFCDIEKEFPQFSTFWGSDNLGTGAWLCVRRRTGALLGPSPRHWVGRSKVPELISNKGSASDLGGVVIVTVLVD